MSSSRVPRCVHPDPGACARPCPPAPGRRGRLCMVRRHRVRGDSRCRFTSEPRSDTRGRSERPPSPCWLHGHKAGQPARQPRVPHRSRAQSSSDRGTGAAAGRGGPAPEADSLGNGPRVEAEGLRDKARAAERVGDRGAVRRRVRTPPGGSRARRAGADCPQDRFACGSRTVEVSRPQWSGVSSGYHRIETGTECDSGHVNWA